MKRLFTLLAIVGLCHLNTFSQKKYEMVVEKTDGTETVFNVEDIVCTYFRERSGGDASYTSCPDNNHPHWIDLGLPSGTKWQCCNVGTNTPEGYGGYYTFDQAQAYNPPSFDQIVELLVNTSYVWTTQNGVNGGKFTGRNGGTIFLPAAGYRWGGELHSVGSYGSYWSSTPLDGSNAYGLDFRSFDAGWEYFYGRYDSRLFEPSVRSVR